MKRPIFRKDAIDRLSSPEQLDQLIQVTSPRSWLMLLGLFLLLGTFMTWGLLGRVSTRVRGEGIILGGNVYEIVPVSGSGQVLRMHVEVGESVRAGDVVAEVDQPELLQEIRNARAKVQELRDERDHVATFGVKELEIQNSYIEGQRDNLTKVVEEQRSLVELLTRQLAAERDLLEKGMITAQQLLPTQQSLSETRDTLESAQAELTQLRSAQLKAEFDAGQQLIAIEQRLNEAERSVEQLEALHELRSKVVSPYDGRILEMMVDGGSVVRAGQPLMKLSLEARGVEAFRVVLYVNGQQGKRIKKGMPVQVAPVTVKPEEYGYLVGRVSGVAEFPSTTEGMQHSLKNDQLVERLSALGSPFKVVVRLFPDAKAPSGFAWTAGRGPEVEIRDGTLASGLVVVETRRPIELVVPEIKKRLSLL